MRLGLAHRTDGDGRAYEQAGERAPERAAYGRAYLGARAHDVNGLKL